MNAPLSDDEQFLLDSLISAVHDEEVQIAAMRVQAYGTDHAALVAIWQDDEDQYVVKPLALLASDELLSHVVPPEGREEE